MGPRPPTEHSPHSQIPLPLLVSNMIRNITRLSSVLPKRVITPKSLITVKQFHSTRPLLSSNKMSQPFLAAIQKRRTYYSISPELPSGLTEAKIEEIVKHIFTHVPSSFNSQSTRAIVLFREEHNKLWDIVRDVLKAIVPAEAFPATEQRIKGFKNGYGTIMFFEDSIPVQKLQEGFPLYKDNFPVWSQHTCAMHQFSCWTALENEGLGANLQHYNPIIDEKVRSTWNVPATWSLSAQLVFGKPAGEPGPKEFQPLEDRIKFYGKSQ